MGKLSLLNEQVFESTTLSKKFVSSDLNKLPLTPILKKRVTQIVADDLCPEITDIYNLQNTNSQASRRNAQTSFPYNRHYLTDSPNIFKNSSSINLSSKLPTLVRQKYAKNGSNENKNKSNPSSSTPPPTVRAISQESLSDLKLDSQNCKTS